MENITQNQFANIIISLFPVFLPMLTTVFNDRIPTEKEFKKEVNDKLDHLRNTITEPLKEFIEKVTALEQPQTNYETAFKPYIDIVIDFEDYTDLKANILCIKNDYKNCNTFVTYLIAGGILIFIFTFLTLFYNSLQVYLPISSVIILLIIIFQLFLMLRLRTLSIKFDDKCGHRLIKKVKKNAD
jgi:hypothetical protein